MKKTSLFILLLFFISLGYAQNTADFFSKSEFFFKTYVKNGRVAYSEIKGNPAALNELIELAKNIAVTKDNRSEYQAFWINGYNLLVIDGIVKNYPIKSPLDKPGFFDKIKNEIGGTSITLNDIENKLLRKNFPKEPRFHFVLVCGGLGCPPIINAAYKPSILDSQLEEQTKLALNDSKFIQLNKNKVKISQIFEWYKGDFEHEGNVVQFINIYKTDKLPETAKISYYPYDWTLNEAN